MTIPPLSPWLAWARELQALSQTGLAFSQSPYDTQRYTRLAEIAAAIVSAYADLPAPTVTAQFLDQPGYATPKVDVRGAVVRGDRVLLVQERSDGRWCLPGGWADVGEAPSLMVAREVREESGLEVVATRLLGVFDGNRAQEPLALYHAYKLIFLCEERGGALRPSDETVDAAWFPFDDLPPLSANRTDTRQLAAVRARTADPALAPAFD
jgi:ADP-ribose pyrophosphatase YjhB (NUDIX family)